MILNEKGEILTNEQDYNLGYLTKQSDGVFVYHLFNKKQLAERQIPILKEELAKTDYQAIKFAEGELSASDYETIKQKRRTWRDEINRLEAIVNKK